MDWVIFPALAVIVALYIPISVAACVLTVYAVFTRAFPVSTKGEGTEQVGGLGWLAPEMAQLNVTLPVKPPVP